MGMKTVAMRINPNVSRYPLVLSIPQIWYFLLGPIAELSAAIRAK